MTRRCCWPIGNPGEVGFAFCDEPTERYDRPYCRAHNGLAFRKERRAPRLRKSQRPKASVGPEPPTQSQSRCSAGDPQFGKIRRLADQG
jgi:hypothetical protein